MTEGICKKVSPIIKPTESAKKAVILIKEQAPIPAVLLIVALKIPSLFQDTQQFPEEVLPLFNPQLQRIQLLLPLMLATGALTQVELSQTVELLLTTEF